MIVLTPRLRMPLMIATACAAITAMTVGNMPAHGQTNRFQTVIGGSANDVSEGGIVTTADGHMMMVGSTNSFAPEQDVYVAKLDVCGNVLWARSYDIGRTDIGRKIRQTAGGFVIVGTTETVDPCCGSRDAFLLHIDNGGGVVWTRRYGLVQRNMIDDARDLRVDPANGDIYATGFTNASGTGSYEGWIWKVNAGGTTQWSNTYGGQNVDLLYGLELVCDNAVLAVGSTRSYTPDANQDVYMVKVDRTTGALLWATHRGDETEQELKSVTIDENGIVAAGGWSGFREYVETIDCTAGFTFFENTIGDPDPELSCEVNEIKAFNGSFYIVGSWGVAAPIGGFDVHVSRLGVTMSPVVNKFYGGNTDDWGFSITPTYDPDINGWYDMAVAATTNSFGSGNFDMYAIGADWVLSSGCNEMDKPINELDPPFTTSWITPIVTPYTPWDRPTTTTVVRIQNEILCTNCGGGIAPNGGAEISDASTTLHAH